MLSLDKWDNTNIVSRELINSVLMMVYASIESSLLHAFYDSTSSCFSALKNCYASSKVMSSWFQHLWGYLFLFLGLCTRQKIVCHTVLVVIIL